MEEQDRIEGQEDVEGHRHKHKPQASEDAPRAGRGDVANDVWLHRHKHKLGPASSAPSEDTPRTRGRTEDFELHRSHFKPMEAEDSPKDEGGDDDFELHRKAHKAL